MGGSCNVEGSGTSSLGQAVAGIALSIVYAAAVLAILLAADARAGTRVHGSGHHGDPARGRTRHLYTSPGGARSGSCAASHPCSLAAAKAAVRVAMGRMRSGHARPADIVVEVGGGTYQLAAPLRFEAADSGVAGHPVVWRAAPGGGQPVLSGARRVNGWRLADPSANLWVTSVPPSLRTRQLYIDGARIPVAQGPPPVELTETTDGYEAADSRMAGWRNPNDIEFVYERSNGPWAEARCRVGSIAGTAITMSQPCWDYSTRRDSGLEYSLAFPNFRENTRPTRIENAFELLRPGHWYLDESSHRLYYMATEGQDPRREDVEVPVAEQLLVGAGTLAHPVHDLIFTGLDFAYTTWLEPSEPSGFADVQATVHVGNYDPDHPDPSCDTADPVAVCFLRRPPAAVQLNAARDVRIEGAQLRHLGSAGIAIEHGSSDNVIQGNELTDISGVGIFIGNVDDPHPEDVGAGPEEISERNTVADNLIHDIGAEFHSATGIVNLYTRHTRIVHNQLYDLPWDGIDSGAVTGQIDSSVEPERATNVNSDNLIADNLVYDYKRVLEDGGGIYLTGHQGETRHAPDGSIDRDASFEHGTLIEGNVVYDSAQQSVALYDDLGSQWITWRHNAEWGAPLGNGGCAPIGHFRFLDNYAADPVGQFYEQICSPPPTDLEYAENHELAAQPGPGEVPDDLLAGAGLEPAYRKMTTGRAPLVQSFEPDGGVAAGPTAVLVSGSGFDAGTTVAWGATTASAVRVVSSNFLVATAPAGTPLGQLTVTTAGGATTAPAAAPLPALYNVRAISDDWASQTGEFSVGFFNRDSYSAQGLAAGGATPGGTVVHGGLSFAWPEPVGEDDAVVARGQAVAIAGHGNRLGFLVAGLGAVGGTGAVVYADGTQQTYQLSTGAWNEPTPGEQVALTSYRNDAFTAGCCPDEPAYIYFDSVPLQPGKQVKEVILPFTSYSYPAPDEKSSLVVFSLAIG